MAVIAGRVAIVPSGEFEYGQQYKRLDAVRYQGGVYMAKKDNSSEYPTYNNDNEYWMFMVGATDIADYEHPGIVMPDGKTIMIKEDGTITGASTEFTGTMEEFEQAKEKGEIQDGQIVNIKDDYEDGTLKFTSGDKENPMEYTDVPVIVDNEPAKSFREKVSTVVANTRYFSGILNDFEVMKREQMAPYGYFGIEWDLDELMELVRAEKWHKFAIGDYWIETTTTGEKILYEIAGKKPYLYCGDQGNGLTSPHIVGCPRDCLETYYRYNDAATNAGGYAASLMPENLETEANKFSSKLQGYMTTIRRLENNKDAWAWASRRIFLPGNPELVGFHGWADRRDGGAFNQLPLFKGGNAHLLKGAGYNKKKIERQWYWTADPSVEYVAHFCAFAGTGDTYYRGAVDEGGIAPWIVLS